MKRIGSVIALMVLAMPAWAQGSRHDDIVFGPAGHPLANATVTVCVATATGAPCSPLAQLYTDDTLSVGAPNPLQTDGLGNYHFYAAPGRYQIQFSGAGVQGGVTMNDIILPSDPSSPVFSSVSTSGAISAQTMSLGGNLSVSGNAAVNGSLTVSGGPVPSTAVANNWTAPQVFTSGPYFRSGSPWFDVKGFCASGSQQQTTGSITGGQATLALASAIDFAACPTGSGQPGEGITIYHAGPAPTIAAPTAVSITPVGGTATTAYGYQLVANDYAGGVTAPTTALTISNGEPLGSLSATIYNNVCFTTSAGAESYTLYRSVSGGAYAYLSTFFDSTPPSIAYCFHDTNSNNNGQTWGTGTSTVPDWGSSTVPSAAADDWCQTTIASGAGTASLTLSANCPNSATGKIVKHDDTPAIQAAVNACNVASGGVVYFPVSGNFNMGNINWPDTRAGRGWIILDLVGQLTITYPITFGSPAGGGRSQNFFRITGNGGTTATGNNSSQFPFMNSGHINSGFVSPVIHTVYQNATSLAPFVFDNLSIFNRGIGGGDGIVSEGGNSSGLTIKNVDVAVTGTGLKIGYGGIAGGANGPCTGGGGFGAYVDHSTFTSYFAGDALTNCDGWDIDLTFGMAYFDTVTLVGQGIHTMGMGTTEWDHIYQESGSTLGFITWDTSAGTCTPTCGLNTFRHVEISDSGGGANAYFINTVNGTSTPANTGIDLEEVEGITTQLVAGTTPIASCTVIQNGPITPDQAVGGCTVSSGMINGRFAATGGGHQINAPANMLAGSGLTPFYSLSLGGTSGLTPLGIQGPTGYTGDYLDVLDPSSNIGGTVTKQVILDGNYIWHAYGFQQNTASTQSNWFGPLGNFVGGTTAELSASGSNSALGLKVSGSGDPLFIYDTSGSLQSFFSAAGAFSTAKAITSTLAAGTAPLVVASTTPVANLTAQYAQSTQFTGTASAIGGSSLTAGQCASGTVTITGATTSMSVAVSPATDPGTGFTWEGFISAANTVTVRVCNVTGGALTPASSAYNVRVIQ
jgi:hypothetical protein